MNKTLRDFCIRVFTALQDVFLFLSPTHFTITWQTKQGGRLFDYTLTVRNSHLVSVVNDLFMCRNDLPKRLNYHLIMPKDYLRRESTIHDFATLLIEYHKKGDLKELTELKKFLPKLLPLSVLCDIEINADQRLANKLNLRSVK